MSRFVISDLRDGPEEFRDQLPIIGATIDLRTGPDGQDYFYARLDEPIRARIDALLDPSALTAEQLGSDIDGPFLWVTDIVMRASTPGEQPHHGMHRFPVDLAYVIDPSYLDDPVLDFKKILPFATAAIDDVPDDAPAGTSQPPPAVDVATPPDLPTRFSATAAAGIDAASDPPPQHTPADVHDAAGDRTAGTPTAAAVHDEQRRAPTPAPARTGDEPHTGTDSPVPRARPRRPPIAQLPETPTRPPRLAEPPASPAQRAARTPPPPPAAPWHNAQQPAFPDDLNVRPRRGPSRRAVLASVAILAGIIVIAGAAWMLASGGDGEQSTAPSTTTVGASQADLDRIKSQLPKGYTDDDCTPTANAARPTVTCAPNADPGGPQSATYAIYPDEQSLQQAFTATIATFDRMVCPGNIQSPGPWRRNAAPTQVAGTLFCGTQRGQAVVVWTSDAESLLNVAEAGAQGPSLAQLYTWWTLHS